MLPREAGEGDPEGVERTGADGKESAPSTAARSPSPAVAGKDDA
jgi:hypothetical protein